MFYKKIRKRLFLNVSKFFFFLIIYSVGFKMCISCWELFFCFYFFFLTKYWKLSFCCSLILKESSSSLSILACIHSYIKCRYLSGIKKIHTKAPVSLHFTTFRRKQFYKKKTLKKRSIKSESGTPAITEVF